MNNYSTPLALAAAALLLAGSFGVAEAGGRKHHKFKFFKPSYGVGVSIGFVRPKCGFWRFGTFYPCTYYHIY